MNITHITDSANSLLGQPASRSDARYGLPTPLLNEEEGGGGDVYPNDESEVGP